MTDARRRAEERRLSYEGSIVPAGTPKPRLRGASFTMERLEAMWELCVTQFEASGRVLPTFARSEMPGELFRIER
jgi:hypothetical protein